MIKKVRNFEMVIACRIVVRKSPDSLRYQKNAQLSESASRNSMSAVFEKL